MDLAKLTDDRDQLFAEAVQRYRAGGQWWPDAAFEAEHIKPQQEARYEADVWEEPIASYLIGRAKASVGEIAKDGLFIDTGRIATTDARRISACLQRMGWHRGKKDSAGRIAWLAPEGHTVGARNAAGKYGSLTITDHLPTSWQRARA